MEVKVSASRGPKSAPGTGISSPGERYEDAKKGSELRKLAPSYMCDWVTHIHMRRMHGAIFDSLVLPVWDTGATAARALTLRACVGEYHMPAVG